MQHPLKTSSNSESSAFILVGFSDILKALSVSFNPLPVRVQTTIL